MLAKAKKGELPRTLQEFDRWHAEQPERWEFINGHPVMMAPACNAHTIIKGNIFGSLRTQLCGWQCQALVDGPEVKSKDLSAIPDVVVTCDPIDLDRGQVDAPTVIIEVLSRSSERDDAGRKWQGYCLIPSLKHYLVVAQELPFVMLHTRVGDFEWAERIYKAGSIELEAIEVALAFDEIYEGVEFPPATPAVFDD